MATVCEVGMNSIQSHEKEHLKDSKHKSRRKKHSSSGHINADSSTKDKHVPDNTKERKSSEHSKCKYKSAKHAHILSNSDHFTKDKVRKNLNRGYEFSPPESYIDNESRFSYEWPERYNTDLIQKIEYLSKQVSYLTEENLRLSNALYNIRGHSETETESEVCISFKEKRLDEKFSSVLRDLIVELTSGHLDIQELKNFISSKKQNTNEAEGNPPEDLFSLDISTASETSYTIVPKYETSFNEILDQKDESDAKPESYDGKNKRFPKVCFNCSGDHNVGQCPHKIDQRKVNIARRQIKSFCPPTVRYHVHGKKEAGFKPGIISDDLREALDLKRNQIPLYVYRMRLLGYPPGWLAEAAVESSGITVYGSDGNVVAEENCEDGEVDATDIRVQYDPDKLIDFPGFNVPLPPNFVDESQELGMPPLQFHQLRSAAEIYMSKPDVRPRWKRKLKLQEGNQSKIQRCEEDMEVDEDIGGGVLDESSDCAAEFIPPLPTEAPPPPPPPDDAVPPPLPDDAPPPIPSDDSNEVLLNINNSDSHEFSNASVTGSSMNSPAHLPQTLKLKNFDEPSSGTSSPSLTELEEMKKRLVLELGFSSYDSKLSSKLVTDVTIPQDIVKLKETEPQEFLESVATPENSNDISSFSESSSNFDRMETKVSTPEYSSPDQGENKSNKSKFVMLGTPSLSRHSSYSKLPDYERFSENVSPHLSFENLPNSTGTYEKMKCVLKKVKDKLNSFMQSN